MRKNPYIMLLGHIKEYCHKVRFRHTVEMFNYPKNNLSGSWNLTDLYERTKAAEQLGYDVQLTANDVGLIVHYKKKVPDVPYEWG